MNNCIERRHVTYSQRQTEAAGLVSKTEGRRKRQRGSCMMHRRVGGATLLQDRVRGRSVQRDLISTLAGWLLPTAWRYVARTPRFARRRRDGKPSVGPVKQLRSNLVIADSKHQIAVPYLLPYIHPPLSQFKSSHRGTRCWLLVYHLLPSPIYAVPLSKGLHYTRAPDNTICPPTHRPPSNAPHWRRWTRMQCLIYLHQRC